MSNADILRKMTVVVGGVTFTKIIGYYNGNVYANEYGEYIKDSSAVYTFDELIDCAVEFLKASKQDENMEEDKPVKRQPTIEPVRLNNFKL